MFERAGNSGRGSFTMSAMRNGTIRWTIYLIAIFVAGPAAGALVGVIHAIDGGPASPFVSASPGLGLASAVGALAIALVIGLFTGKFLGLGPAMTASGLVVAWTAWRTADVDQLIRTAQSGRPLKMLAVEGVILGTAGFLIALFCWLASGRQDASELSDEGGNRAARKVAGAAKYSPGIGGAFMFRKLFGGKGGPASIAVGLVAGGVAAWLIAATPLKGQAIFAAIAAGAFAAAAGRLVDFEAPVPAMFFPIAILAAIGPLTGIVMSGSGGIVAAAYKGTLFPLANISPLDWIAGGLLGIPLGVSWAGSMIEKRT